MLIPPVIANTILIVVTAVWVTSFAASLLSTSYHPDPQINLIFMGIVGAAWANAIRKGGGDTK